jgi:hypothetical protein
VVHVGTNQSYTILLGNLTSSELCEPLPHPAGNNYHVTHRGEVG